MAAVEHRAASHHGAATFWEFILTSKLLHGDGFARIWRKGRYNPEIVSIEPLHPLAVQPLRVVTGSATT